MAAITKNNKVIFIHIYRTGGHTIRNFFKLGTHSKDDIGDKHAIAKDVRTILSKQGRLCVWDEAFKFSIVRNPFSWLVSTYNYVIEHPGHKENKIAKCGFSQYLEWIATKGLNKKTPIGGTSHFLQYDFLYDENGNLLVDFVGRFEQFDSVISKISKKTEKGVIKKTNSSKYTKSYQNYYQPDDVKLIRSVWRKDLETFGYDWGYDV